jgi:hypothetical protein
MPFITVGADLIVVQEYDFHLPREHCPALPYLGHGTEPVGFGAAMAAAGYHALLFEGPKRDGTGLGVFAKANRFSVKAGTNAAGTAAAATGAVAGALGAAGAAPVVATVSPGGWAPGAALGSFDFYERHHPCNKSPSRAAPAEGAAAAAGISSAAVPVPASEEVPLADRKHFAFALLELTGTGRRVGLFGVHLMTTSRDKPGKVRSPRPERWTPASAVFEVHWVCPHPPPLPPVEVYSRLSEQ